MKRGIALAGTVFKMCIDIKNLFYANEGFIPMMSSFLWNWLAPLTEKCYFMGK
jgi:hypothetical protein